MTLKPDRLILLRSGIFPKPPHARLRPIDVLRPLHEKTGSASAPHHVFLSPLAYWSNVRFKLHLTPSDAVETHCV